MKTSTSQTMVVTVLFCLRNDLEKKLHLSQDTFSFRRRYVSSTLLPFGEPINIHLLKLLILRAEKFITYQYLKLLLNDKCLPVIAFRFMFPTYLLADAVSVAASSF